MRIYAYKFHLYFFFLVPHEMKVQLVTVLEDDDDEEEESLASRAVLYGCHFMLSVFVGSFSSVLFLLLLIKVIDIAPSDLIPSCLIATASSLCIFRLLAFLHVRERDIFLSMCSALLRIPSHRSTLMCLERHRDDPEHIGLVCDVQEATVFWFCHFVWKINPDKSDAIF